MTLPDDEIGAPLLEIVGPRRAGLTVGDRYSIFIPARAGGEPWPPESEE